MRTDAAVAVATQLSPDYEYVAAGLKQGSERYGTLPMAHELKRYLGARGDVFNFDIETRTVSSAITRNGCPQSHPPTRCVVLDPLPLSLPSMRCRCRR